MKAMTPIDHKETKIAIKKPAAIHFAVYTTLFAAWFVMQLHK